MGGAQTPPILNITLNYIEFPRGKKTCNNKSAGDGHYLYLQTQFGEDRCTQFRVIVVTDPQTIPQTHKQTRRQDRLQYTAPLSLARSVTTASANRGCGSWKQCRADAAAAVHDVRRLIRGERARTRNRIIPVPPRINARRRKQLRTRNDGCGFQIFLRHHVKFKSSKREP